MLNILMIDSGVASHPKLDNAEICRTGFRNQRTAEDITDTVGHGTAVASLILKGTDPEKLARVRATQFKKGDRPVNEMPVGTIVVSSDGYKLRKKQMEGTIWERWEFLHRAVWEEHNGPIPEGMMITFKDSNKLNCDIDNLMTITKGENSALTRYGYRFEDPDLTEAGLAVVRLKQAAAKKRRKTKK